MEKQAIKIFNVVHDNLKIKNDNMIKVQYNKKCIYGNLNEMIMTYLKY